MCGNKKDDRHEEHVWLLEPSIPRGHNVLTPAGADNIAHHKYKSGSSTALDTFCSPNLWEPITNLFPMWLAPNLVTTIGGMFCLTSFLVSNAYLIEFKTGELVEFPRWLFALNGACMFIYYTLDCCDGKQARRTNSSTPLGQLFDHGVDCLANLCHLQLAQCIVQNPPHLALLLQALEQFTFWQAQWEEYYTGILPHATGNIGVTEVNYGLALWSIATSIVGRDFYDIVLTENPPPYLERSLTGRNQAMLVKHAMVIGWLLLHAILIVLSWMRVYHHLNSNKKGHVFFSAMSKLVSPLLLVIVGVWGLTDIVNAVSLSLGLCFCLITIKLIVFSMARMAYASIQTDIMPLVLVVAYTKLNEIDSPLCFQVLDGLYLVRVLYWTHKAIYQLCKRLQVQLFRIPYKKEE